MPEVPDDALEEAERLTRLAREAVDESEAETYRQVRADLLADYDYTARVREEDETLVLYPSEWTSEDGTVHPERIDDTDRGIEIALEGPNDPDDWDTIEEHNDGLVATVAAEHGEIHAANARAFADFMGNHYAKRVENATSREVQEFLTDYFTRNVWPSDEQKAEVETSLDLLFEAAEKDSPDLTAERR